MPGIVLCYKSLGGFISAKAYLKQLLMCQQEIPEYI